MGILLFGTLWFWLLLSASAILIIWFLESALGSSTDKGGGYASTITILAFLVLYYFFGSKEDVYNFFICIKDNPGRSIAIIGIYICAGLIWSIFKWYFFLQNKKQELVEKSEAGRDVYESDFPQAKDNKNRIVTWMSYWPFSAFWTLINEPVKKVFRFIYTSFEKMYVAMADKIFADLKTKIKNK